MMRRASSSGKLRAAVMKMKKATKTRTVVRRALLWK